MSRIYLTYSRMNYDLPTIFLVGTWLDKIRQGSQTYYIRIKEESLLISYLETWKLLVFMLE